MSDVKTVAVLIGSLRKASFNRRLAHILIGLAPASLKLEIVEIGDLPMFNQDLDDAGAPAEWTAFRGRMKNFDGWLFVSPEYNRSIPGVLKNALDVGSRPYGQSIWAGKPAAVATSSPGATGGFGANHHLRQCLVTLDVPTLQQPEIYLSRVDALFNESGGLADPKTGQFLAGFMQTFAAWVSRHGAG